jgi:hypothetical protein
MALYAAMAIEGVLAKDIEQDIAKAAPLREGIQLYEALRRVWKLALVTSYANRDKVDHWLRINQMHDHIMVEYGPGGRAQHLVALRRAGFGVELFVDADPRVVAEVLGMGTAALLFASPSYARPEFQPDAVTGVRPWAEISKEIEDQNAKRDREPRTTADLVE